MKNSILIRIIALLLFLAGFFQTSWAQQTPNQNQTAAAISPDTSVLDVLQHRFQTSMRWMDSILAIPISPTGPYPWEEDEASKEVSKLFHARSLFYPYGNIKAGIEADSMWADRKGITSDWPHPPAPRCENGNWQSIGPVGDPEPSNAFNSTRNRNGRLDRITFKPGDPNTLYVASGMGGGLWKVNGTTGNAVQLGTDHISLHNGVSSIAAIPGRLIIATGTRYGKMEWESWQWACTGVYFSNNDGLNWVRATVTDKNGQDPFAQYGFGHWNFVSEIQVKPNDPNKMLMSVYSLNLISDPNPLNYGALFSSSDGGVTWNEVNDPALTDRFCQDLRYNPTNPNIVYLAGLNHLYKSTNAGQNWTDITSRLVNYNSLEPLWNINNDPYRYALQWHLMRIMVPTQGCTSSDGNHVIVLAKHYDPNNDGDYVLYHSTNAFSSNVSPHLSTSTNEAAISWAQMYHYGYAMTHDPNKLYLAGHIIQRSDNGGIDFITTNTYGSVTHPDHQQIAIPPYDGTNAGIVFAATDGGLWRSNDYAQTFTALNTGLVVNQFYGVGASQTDNTILAGSQDNSTIRMRNDQSWKAVTGGDGNRFSAISPIDPELYAWADLQGNTVISFMKRLGPTSVVPASFAIEPGYHDRPFLYIGTTILAASTKMYFVESDGTQSSGNTFKNALAPLDQSKFSAGNVAVFFDYCRSQPNVIYAATLGQWKDGQGVLSGLDPNVTPNYGDPNGKLVYNLFKSTDGGQNWTSISPNKIGVTGMISSIAVDPADPNHLWITYSGYANNFGTNQNVYVSNNGGTTWLPYWDGLPKGNSEKILFQQNSDDKRLFLAMESGIFYRTENMSDWECYENNLPFTGIKDIDINYCSGKIIAATFGRGVWESDFIDDEASYVPGFSDEIATNTTWSSTKTIRGSIHVKPGGILTISGSGTVIHMPRNSRIYVEKNAKLIIDGATVTNGCDGFHWHGVDLWGDNQQQPLPQYQGYFEMKNGAVLENARFAVSNFAWDNWAFGGGIIKVSNSTFHNCWRAVQLNDYGNHSYLYNGVSQCSFDHSNFLIDNPNVYESGGKGEALFSSFNTMGGIKITNCNFENAIPVGEFAQGNREYGIYIFATGAKIDQCSFEGLKGGVYSGGYTGLPSRADVITSNQFTRTTENVTLAASEYGDIRGNSMTNMYGYSALSSQGYIYRSGNGIYLDHAKGTYVGCGNNINGGTDDPMWTSLQRFGIVINNSDPYATIVIDNIISNTHAATQTQNQNTKLNIFCNQYSNNDFAWSINPSSVSGFLNNQGTGCLTTDIRAGNQFINNLHDIASGLTTSWTYYAGNGSNEVPNWSGAVSVIACNTNANSQCNKPLRCYSVWNSQNQIDILNEYHGLVTAGQKESADGHYAFGQVIRGYNALQDLSSMQTFLEGENDDRSRKLLIPMYLEQGEYGKMSEALTALTLSTRERTAYNNYYGLLETLKQDSRRIDSLTTTELALVHSLATDSVEVTPYAKGLLEWAYAEAWDHPIEPIPVDEMSYMVNMPETQDNDGSKLMNAVPNPTSGITSIKVFVGKVDAVNDPALVIHDTKGKEMFRQRLIEGENSVNVNTTSWTPGIYLYSLNCNNRVMATKKLSVVK